MILGCLQTRLKNKTTTQIFLIDQQYFADVRGFDEDILKNVDHVIHLAAISNDPIGNKFEKITNEINFEASVDILKKSIKMKVKNFTFASSCIMDLDRLSQEQKWMKSNH